MMRETQMRVIDPPSMRAVTPPPHARYLYASLLISLLGDKMVNVVRAVSQLSLSTNEFLRVYVQEILLATGRADNSTRCVKKS